MNIQYENYAQCWIHNTDFGHTSQYKILSVCLSCSICRHA